MGKINSKNIVSISLPWYFTQFGFKTVPSGGFIGDMKWFFSSASGLISFGILGSLVAFYYLYRIQRDIRKKLLHFEVLFKSPSQRFSITEDIPAGGLRD